MARTPSSTVIEIEALLGLRGQVRINSANRALVHKWLTANGVRAVIAKSLDLEGLNAAYNDVTDEKLSYLQAANEGEEGTGNDPETGLPYREKIGAAPNNAPAGDLQDALRVLMSAIGTQNQSTGREIKRDELIKVIREELKNELSRPLSVTIKDTTTTLPAELRHRDFDKILKAVACGNVAIIGPAGSGKTTLAEQIAKALGVDFYFTGAIASEYKLTGFIDAQGRVIHTAFRKAYEKGGLFLFDEIDGSLPGAILAFNAALANGHADFPDGSVKRHPNFYCMAAANTYWTGADRVYVGRNQLDGATLDRFIFIDLPYDEKLERALAGNEDWVNEVQGIRRKVRDQKVRHIVSPRASIMGAKMLAAGLHIQDVRDMVLYKGMDKDTRNKIAA